MATGSLQITISFDALVDAISKLDLIDKQRLLDILEQEVAEAEEAAWEQDPAVRAELQASRDEIAAGDFVTLEEYQTEQQGGGHPNDTKPAP